MTVLERPSTLGESAIGFDLRSIPPIPPLANGLLILDIDDDNAQRILFGIIESEPQPSIRLIGMANSVAHANASGILDSIGAAGR